MSVSRKQALLRTACLKGDIKAVESLLKDRTSFPKSLLEAVFGTEILTSCGFDDSPLPADLHHAYADDKSNTPLHYIATGLHRSGLLRTRLHAT